VASPLRPHRFDPVAAVLGLLFLAAGVVVLTGGELIDEGRVLVPLGLIGLGAALLARVAGRGSAGQEGPGHEVGAEGGEDG